MNSTRGRPFEEGKSGNPAGRPKGARNQSTLALEAMFEGEAEEISRKAIEMAKQGDTVALRLCLDRLIPVRRDRPVRFEMPEITKTADLPQATAALLRAVTNGDITPSEAADVSRTLDAHLKAIETAELADRLTKLEQGQTA